jgi:3',5'-cyclic AMP phosphodiesterase CpdA
VWAIASADRIAGGNKPSRIPVSGSETHANREGKMSDTDEITARAETGVSRRGLLKCMSWAGTGVLWSLSGGVPKTLGLIGDAAAATNQLTFVQISDSHIGFHLPANPNPAATLGKAIGKIKGMTAQPAFLVHTGDVSHTSKQEQWDTADQIIGGAGKQVFHIPGEHDVADVDNGKAYLARYGKGTKGRGWYSFDVAGVHFVGLVNVYGFLPGFKPSGLAQLGNDQLEWLEKDLAHRSASTPIVVMAHVPLWTVYEKWGWGTVDAGQAFSYLKRFGSVTVLNGHIHQIFQKVEGNITFHTARSTAFPLTPPGPEPHFSPLKVAAGELGQYLGIRTVDFVRRSGMPALTDAPLAA